MRSILRLFIFVVFAGSTDVQAQDNNAQKALQKAQFMLRQVSSEKTELQSQVDGLKQQVDQLTRELAATKSNAAGSQQKTEEKYTGAIAQWKQRDSETNATLAVTKDQLKQQLTQSKNLETSLQKQTENFSVCYENNKKLYELNHQLLDRYENKGIGDVLKQREPFTGMAKVEVENLVQDYRYQLDDLKLQPEQAKNN